MNRIYLLLLSLLGFAGCDGKDGIGAEDDSGNRLLMYGTPYAEYAVKGRVTDAAGRAIAGIEVRTGEGAAVRTDAQGAYAVAGQSDILYRPPFVTFTDTDGPAGGGDFAAERLEVRFSERDRTGGGDGWMYGRFERTGVDVVLSPETGKKE